MGEAVLVFLNHLSVAVHFLFRNHLYLFPLSTCTNNRAFKVLEEMNLVTMRGI